MGIDLASELTDLRRAILTMGAAVEERVQQAFEALLGFDRDIARIVRKGDDEIDQMEIEIEEECLRVLALTQPVASDLRFVLAVMRINSELERIADLARSVAKRANSLSKMPPLELPEPLILMTREASRMVSDALTAFSDEDPGRAQHIREADRRVDDLQKELFTWVREEIPLHVESTDAAIDIMSAARKIERIADLATNLAEEVIFLVEGRLIRHGER